MLRLAKSFLLLFLISFQAPLVAHACGSCVLGLFDKYIPPISYWIIFACLWFLALSVLSTITNIKLYGTPKLLGAILLTLILGIVGAVSIGPIGFLFLLLASVGATIDLLRKKQKYSNKVKPYVITVGMAGLVGLLFMISFSIWTHKTRSDVDFYLKWNNTYAGKMVLSEILGKGPEARDEVIALLNKGDTDAVAVMGKAISKFDNPLNDIHVLLNAFERCKYRDSNFEVYSNEVEVVLRSLTGLDLPDGTHPRKWKEEWKRIQKQRKTNNMGTLPIKSGKNSF